MMKTRLAIMAVCANLQMTALHIAVRYACQRTQFKTMKNSKHERQIIDYQTHQVKIANCMGNFFMMLFVN